MNKAAGSSPLDVQKRLVAKVILAWLPLSLSIVAAFSGGVLLVIQARLASQIIANVFIDQLALSAVSSALLALLVVILGRAIFILVGEVSSRNTARVVKQSLQKDLIDHLFLTGPAHLHGYRSAELVTTLTSGIEALDAYFSQYLPQLALVVLVPLTILAAVFPIDRLSGLVFLFTAPLIPIFMFLIGSQAEALTRRQWGELGRLAAHFLDTLQGLATLKMLGQSQARSTSIARASELYRKRTLEVLRVTFLSALVLELVGTISTAMVAVEIGLRLLSGGMDYRQALFILILAPEFYVPLRNLGLRFHASTAGVSAARRIFEILSEPPALPLAAPLQAINQAARPGDQYSNLSKFNNTRGPSEIIFDSVSYTYPGSESPALRALSFTIPAGKRIALVGPNGAGKSTLLHLLLRFIEPTGGDIRLGVQHFNSIDAGEWRRQVAWVSQRPYLFNDTIRANLLLGRQSAGDGELISVLAWAHLDDFVLSLPDGLDTRVGEQGMRLSGGQAQRLALARAYLKDAPYLFLDEPGASLDPEQDAFLIEALDQLSKDRTTIMNAHRFNTVSKADLIFVLDHGNLVESVSPEALSLQNGVYSNLLVPHLKAAGKANQ